MRPAPHCARGSHHGGPGPGDRGGVLRGPAAMWPEGAPPRDFRPPHDWQQWFALIVDDIVDSPYSVPPAGSFQKRNHHWVPGSPQGKIKLVLLLTHKYFRARFQPQTQRTCVLQVCTLNAALS